MTSDHTDESAPGQTTGGRVAAAAGIMVAAILASRVLALVRDMVISYYFGAGEVTDAYNAAFKLPDLLYYLIAGGALSSAFIPVFSQYLTLGDEDTAWEVFSIFGTAIALILLVVILLGEIFTPWLLLPLTPGFDAAKLDLTVALTRIVFPAQICFFLGGLMMSTLYARNQFLIPALGPVIYNLGIIAGGAIGGAFFGPRVGVYGLAWGVVAGALVGNVLLQVWAMRRFGARYRFSLRVSHPGVVKAAKLMLPVLLGLSLPQLCSILSTPFASDLGDGPITWLDRGLKVMQLPLGVFAQGLSVAIFPTLSALAARGDLDGLRRHFSLGFRAILFLTLPCAGLIIALATPIAALLFQRGLWTPQDTHATAMVTIFYALGIFAVSGQQIVNRGFYAMQNTLTPMIAGTAATVIFLALAVGLVGVPDFNARVGDAPEVALAIQMERSNLLALAYTLSMGLYLAALLVLFRRSLGGIRGGEIISSAVRVVLAATAAGAAAWGTGLLLGPWLHLYDAARLTLTGALIGVMIASSVGLVVYGVAVHLMRVPEAGYVFGLVAGKLRKLPVVGRYFPPAREGAASASDQR